MFAPLLEKEGIAPDKAKKIAEAAFFERTSNPVMARQSITTVLPSIEPLDTPIGGLFRPELENRMQLGQSEGPR